MFYLFTIEDYVRVKPKHFGLPTKEAVELQLKESYTNYFNKDIGRVIAIVDVLQVGEGIIIPGDGAAYYNSTFKLLVWKPELQEICYGIITEITTFGAFIDLGVMRGVIHISQAMEDYVNYTKSGTLVGKTGKKSLHKGDKCLARIIALSYKGSEPKIGLTMRQPGLGKLEWLIQKKTTKKKESPLRRASQNMKKK